MKDVFAELKEKAPQWRKAGGWITAATVGRHGVNAVMSVGAHLDPTQIVRAGKKALKYAGKFVAYKAERHAGNTLRAHPPAEPTLNAVALAMANLHDANASLHKDGRAPTTGLGRMARLAPGVSTYQDLQHSEAVLNPLKVDLADKVQAHVAARDLIRSNKQAAKLASYQQDPNRYRKSAWAGQMRRLQRREARKAAKSGK